MKNKGLSYLYIFWMIMFTIIPLLLILLFSFTSGDIQNITELKFTLTNYKRFFDPVYIKILLKSINLALRSTVICLILGYPIALIISRENIKKRNAMILLFVLPMWMNFLLRTYAWRAILGKNGFINYIIQMLGFSSANLIYNDGAVILGMIYNFLPFMVLPIYSVLIKIDNNLIEAAEDLGANKFKIFSGVILPLSIPGIMSGVTMVFMPAVSTFVISRLLGGGQYMLIGNLIEQQFLWVGDWNFGSAISIIMMLIILLSMGLTAVFDKNKDKEGGSLW